MKRWRTANLFTPAEVQHAFAALHRNAETLYGVSGTSSPLRPFVRRRGGARGHRRDHIELPLHHMYEASTVYEQLPVEVRLICGGLHEAALSYAQEALRERGVSSAARDEILSNLGRKSVLRVLRYPAGSGCRPHVDPGLCTALLVGSAGGLEVSTTDAVLTPFASRPGCNTAHVTSSPTSMRGEASNMPGTLPHWEPVLTAHTGAAVVMAGNMLGAVSGGALPGVLHRVRRDWVAEIPRTDGQRSPSLHAACVVGGADAETHAGSGVFRFNVIVELRPAYAKRWYTATSGQPPLPSASSPSSLA
ncbi:2OG-Fe(II) oxygenase superfamily [Leishmania donovani]|uniref:2OG-Fe(II) oxygenase family protein n=1 Tax=Leishmania donovani TaxID=5661 RepID=A0A504XVZ7_LEIDO|nr:2OG-Fe(II) oxygenase family protein [Leishmania donovani]CAJ1987562.1 2OG-Fe(II) oxygenase superfamily [Leishmania donovani]VDZ43451.1 2OG-Fe(II)_oxygenase_superfamily_putative/Pfam:PF03171 [Leishmania donovani]